MKFSKKIFSLFLFLFIFPLIAQAGVNTWTSLNGPADGNIGGFVSDSNGNVYANSSGNGIVKYDSQSEQWLQVGSSPVYGNPILDSQDNLYASAWNTIYQYDVNTTNWNAISNNLNLYISRFVIDSQDALYVAGYIYQQNQYKYKIFRYDNSTHIWNDITGVLSISYLDDFIADPKGTVYLTIDSGGNYNLTYRYDSVTNTWSLLTGATLYNPKIIHDPQGGVYALNYNGVFHLNNNSTTWTTVGNSLNGSPNNLVMDNQGNLFVGGSGGISYYDSNTNAWVALNNGLSDLYIYYLAIDSQNNLYAATYNQVFFYDIQNNSWKEINTNFSDNPIYQLFVSSTDDVYLNTYGTGPFAYDVNASSWKSINSGLQNANAYRLAVDSKRNIYALGYNYVYQYNPLNAMWSVTYAYYYSYYNTSLVSDSQGKVYLGSNDYVYAYDDTTNFWTLFSNYVPDSLTSFLIDTQGNVFAGTDDGVFELKVGDNNWVSISNGLDSNYVYAVVQDSQGILYAATSNYIYQYDAGNLLWTPFSANGLSNDDIQDIKIDSKDNFYVLDSWSSIYQYDASADNWVMLNTNQTWYPNTIALDAQDILYAGTDDGVYQYDPATTTWNAFNAGMPANTYVQALVIDHGTFYAGTSGLGVFEYSFPGSVTLSVSDLDLGSAILSQAGTPSVITLTNSGQGPLNITSIDVSGDFAQTNDCGNVVDPGVQCSIQVVLTPTDVGQRTGTLQIITDDQTATVQSVNLTGLGLPASSSNNPNSSNNSGGGGGGCSLSTNETVSSPFLIKSFGLLILFLGWVRFVQLKNKSESMKKMFMFFFFTLLVFSVTPQLKAQQTEEFKQYIQQQQLQQQAQQQLTQEAFLQLLQQMAAAQSASAPQQVESSTPQPLINYKLFPYPTHDNVYTDRHGFTYHNHY